MKLHFVVIIIFIAGMSAQAAPPKLKLDKVKVHLASGKMIEGKVIRVTSDSLLMTFENKLMIGCRVKAVYRKKDYTLMGTIVDLNEVSVTIKSPDLAEPMKLKFADVDIFFIARPADQRDIPVENISVPAADIVSVEAMVRGRGPRGFLIGAVTGGLVGGLIGYQNNTGFGGRELSAIGGGFLGFLVGGVIGVVVGSGFKSFPIDQSPEKFHAIFNSVEAAKNPD